jgi:hypothetical protein
VRRVGQSRQYDNLAADMRVPVKLAIVATDESLLRNELDLPYATRGKVRAAVRISDRMDVVVINCSSHAQGSWPRRARRAAWRELRMHQGSVESSNTRLVRA